MNYKKISTKEESQTMENYGLFYIKLYLGEFQRLRIHYYIMKELFITRNTPSPGRALYMQIQIKSLEIVCCSYRRQLVTTLFVL